MSAAQNLHALANLEMIRAITELPTVCLSVGKKFQIIFVSCDQDEATNENNR